MNNHPQHFFLMQISGIPWVFGNVPSYTYSGYTYVPLLQHGGFTETADGWDLREGQASPGSAEIVLFDQRDSVHPDGWLTWLFASEMTSHAGSTIYRSKINEELPWSSAAVAVLDVLSTTDAPASGILYRGLETLHADHVGAATEFHLVDRGQYGSPVLRHMVGGTADPDNWANPEICGHPRAWTGRYVTVHRAEVSEHGIIGSLSVVWRGVLDGITADDKAETWTLRCSSLLSCLGGKIGLGQAYQSLTPPADETQVFWYLDSDYATGDRFKIFCSGVTLSGSVSISMRTGVLRWPHAYADSGSTKTDNCIWDAEYIYNQSGVGVSLRFGNDDEGALVATFYASEANEVLLTFPLEFALALGFDGIEVRIPAGGSISATNPLSPIFYSPTTDKLYIPDNSEFSSAITAGADPAVAVQMDNSADGGIVAFRVTASGTSATDGDFLKVVPLATTALSVSPTSSTPLAIWCSPEAIPVVVGALAPTSIEFADALRYCLASGGGATDNGDWDVFPEWGLAIPDAYINHKSFESFPADGLPRTYFAFEPVVLADFFKADFQLGACRLAMVRGKISLLPIAGIPDSEQEIAVLEAECLDQLPRMELDPAWAIEEVVLSYNHDVQKDEFQVKGDTYLNAETGSRGGGVTATLEVESRAIRIAGDQDLSAFPAMIADLFARFGRGVFSFSLRVYLFAGYDLQAGDTIRLTHDNLRSPSMGTRGGDFLCHLISAERDWWGDGGVTLLLLHLPIVQRDHGGLYAPAARISNYNNGTGLVVCAAHAYSTSEMYEDAYWFRAGMEVRVFNSSAKDEDDYIDDTIVSVGLPGSNEVTLSPGLLFPIAGTAPGASDRIRFQPWGSQTADQQRRVSIADSADDKLDAVDPPWFFK